MPGEDRSQFPNVKNQLSWQSLKCLVYLISVVNDLQTRANHLHQVEQEEGHSVNLRQQQMAGERALSVTLRDIVAIWVCCVASKNVTKGPHQLQMNGWFGGPTLGRKKIIWNMQKIWLNLICKWTNAWWQNMCCWSIVVFSLFLKWLPNAEKKWNTVPLLLTNYWYNFKFDGPDLKRKKNLTGLIWSLVWKLPIPSLEVS